VAQAREGAYLPAMPVRQIIAGRRSCLSPDQERRVVAKFKAWSKGRKVTTELALAYFLEAKPAGCLWPEFCELLKAKGFIA
jgi:hypothetical protein